MFRSDHQHKPAAPHSAFVCAGLPARFATPEWLHCEMGATERSLFHSNPCPPLTDATKAEILELLRFLTADDAEPDPNALDQAITEVLGDAHLLGNAC